MTLLDRYLLAVKKRLPRSQRDDIAAELRDILLSQVEAEEAARGRSLTDDEVAVILRRFGRPITVAARYGASEHLIGPTVYPSFLIAMRVLAWVVGPMAGLSVLLSLLTADDPIGQAAKTLLLFVMIGLANFALITLSFARIEKNGAFAGLDKWDPRDLPTPANLEPTPRREAVSSLLVMAVYLLIWIGLLPIRSWNDGLNRWLGGAPLPYGLAPIWDVVSPLIVALILTSMIRDIVAIARPQWVALRGYVGIALHAGALLVLIQLVRADAVFVVTDPAGQGAAHIGHFNMLFFVNLLIATVGVSVSAMLAVRRLGILRGQDTSTPDLHRFELPGD